MAADDTSAELARTRRELEAARHQITAASEALALAVNVGTRLAGIDTHGTAAQGTARALLAHVTRALAVLTGVAVTTEPGEVTMQAGDLSVTRRCGLGLVPGHDQ